MNKEAIKKIADTYGYDAQSRQLIEEMAELMVAVNKYHRKINTPLLSPSDYLELQRYIFNITEEMADTIIMIEQIKHLLTITDKNVDHIIEQKLNRQLERIEKNE